MSGTWACSSGVATAVAEAETLSNERLIARLNFLAAGASRSALVAAVVALMTGPQRDLDAVALADAQRDRESSLG